MDIERTRMLVLRDEGARHPFRLALPKKALEVAAEDVAFHAAEPKASRLNEDVHMFLLSFAAFFTAFYLFIF